MRYIAAWILLLLCLPIVYVLSYAPVLRAVYGTNTNTLNACGPAPVIHAFYHPVERLLEESRFGAWHKRWENLWDVDSVCWWLEEDREFHRQLEVTAEFRRSQATFATLTPGTTPPAPTSTASPLPLQERAAAGE